MSVCIWIWICLQAAGIIAPGTPVPGSDTQSTMTRQSSPAGDAVMLEQHHGKVTARTWSR